MLNYRIGNKYHVVVDLDTCSTIVEASNNAITLNQLLVAYDQDMLTQN